MSDTIEAKKETTDTSEQLTLSDQLPKEPVVAEKKTQKKKWIIFASIFAFVFLICALMAMGYFYIADYYKTRFMPGTNINGIACDKLSVEEVSALLESKPLSYELTIFGRDDVVLGRLNEKDIGLRFVSTSEKVEQILQHQNSLYWPFSYIGRYESSHDLDYGTEYDKDMLLACISTWSVWDKGKMTTPQNAYISEYQPQNKLYRVIPEVLGDTLDVEKAKDLIIAAVQERANVLNLEKESCYILPEITADNTTLNAKCEELNLLLSAKITYDWNGTEILVDGDIIQEWIKDEKVVGPKGDFNADISLDEEAVAAFVAAQAKEHDTYGKHRKFTTALGQTISVLNGGYGWKTNKEQETRELLALLTEGAVAKREPVYQVKAAKKGKDDIGSSYIEIDLSNQHLYVHWKGQIVLETDFVSGDMSNGNTTPGGLYRLTYKTTNAVLRGRDYVTPVSYWMPFNGNIGMHDATWRNEFGGDIFMTNGSHGCINLPLDKAQAIYGYVSTGFPIICYYY